MSLSGKERNHLFLNQAGSSFIDISGISGVDSIQDGRAFAIWDFDRDGWQDIVLTNTNTPILNLYRNQLGSLTNNDQFRGNMVALRFIGGNTNAQPSKTFGCRDGYGVKVTVHLPNKTLSREHRCGEGLAAQNTNRMLIGIGQQQSVDLIRVEWPSGRSQQIENVDSGDLVTVFENAAESADQSGFERSQYVIDNGAQFTSVRPRRLRNLQFSRTGDQTSMLRMYTSMATWCAACRKHMPHLSRIRSHFDEHQLTMIGVPVDEKDVQEKMNAFINETHPAYKLDQNWSQPQRDAFQKIVQNQLGSDVMPATIITTADGQVLNVISGVPTVSGLSQLLDR